MCIVAFAREKVIVAKLQVEFHDERGQDVSSVRDPLNGIVPSHIDKDYFAASRFPFSPAMPSFPSRESFFQITMLSKFGAVILHPHARLLR